MSSQNIDVILGLWILDVISVFVCLSTANTVCNFIFLGLVYMSTIKGLCQVVIKAKLLLLPAPFNRLCTLQIVIVYKNTIFRLHHFHINNRLLIANRMSSCNRVYRRSLWVLDFNQDLSNCQQPLIRLKSKRLLKKNLWVIFKL